MPPALEPAIEHGRVRVLLRPTGEVAVEQQAEFPGTEPVVLEPRALAGGLGRHKWLDRPGEPHHLVVDLDGDVLETAAANVWALENGTLTTPPDDGRLLPGVTRARLLQAFPYAREAPLSLHDLDAADAVLLTSSVRLVTPAGLNKPPSQTAIDLAAKLRDDAAISRKTGSYIR